MKNIEVFKDEMINDLMDFIRIPGIAGKSEGKEYPFGKSTAEALDYVIKIADKMGFAHKNYENYAAEVTLGEGSKIIGILCHADVVDGGSGWSSNPFEPVIKDGEIYGRGVIDDKGPLISCLYAMKLIKDNNLLPEGYQIKMIIGTDEEENWESIDYYLKQKPQLPEISIVPDANFPVIFCEKGLMNFRIQKGDFNGKLNENSYISSLVGGERANVVPTNASCVLKSYKSDYSFEREKELLSHYCKIKNIPIDFSEGEKELVVSVKGKGAHAMTPEKGINAISYLLSALAEIKTSENEKSVIDFYNRYIGLDYNGNGINCNLYDECSGKTTVNVGMAKYEEDAFECTVNLRYPVSYTFDDVSARITKALSEENCKIEWGVCMNPISFNQESEIIKKLMSAYQSVTGDCSSEPISLGGATYARAIPNAVAFGPVFPNQEELAHEADEHYSISDLQRIVNIYMDALLKLCDRS